MSSVAKPDDKAVDIPEKLYDAASKRTYRRMRFFGKGGFAKCYEIVDVATGDVFAGKIVSKKLMMKHNQKEKMTQEISIHRSLNHKNIVGFHSFFDDPLNIYIVLELCKKRSDPLKRPRIHKLFEFEFLAGSHIPNSLPISCLTMAPRADQLEQAERMNRKPLSEMNGGDDTRFESSFLKNNLHDAITASGMISRHNDTYRTDIETLHRELTKLFLAKPPRLANNLDDENTDPAVQPLFWVSKWVDYSDKYGFGYQLSDEGMGVMFNDTTKLIMLANGHNVHFIDKEGQESYWDVNNFPPHLEKKMKLLTYFKRYMMEHLVKAGAGVMNVESDQISRIPHMHTWFRTLCAVVMHLTNGTVQLNFSDHQKIILCPLMRAVTLMDNNKNFRTYRFQTIIEQGCSNDLYTKIRYAHEKIKKLLEKLS
uniref:polo kinase n=1 Tax=Anopheles stephensi TaxID=30069 RepID=A0A182Y5D6_ANOST